MTHTKQHYLDAFRKKFVIHNYALDKDMIAYREDEHDIARQWESKHLEAFISQMYDELVQAERQKIVARLAVDVMEAEVQKNKDLYLDGHIHGLKRAIYLINHELTQGETEECEDCHCHHMHRRQANCLDSCSHCRKEQGASQTIDCTM